MWYVAKHTAVASFSGTAVCSWALDWAHLGGNPYYMQEYLLKHYCARYGNSHYILVVIKIIVV